ncbi:hypothetical protein LINPERPRIM_LOCUS1041, partial [Linum perenne]
QHRRIGYPNQQQSSCRWCDPKLPGSFDRSFLGKPRLLIHHESGAQRGGDQTRLRLEFGF